jgi:ComF family protein
VASLLDIVVPPACGSCGRMGSVLCSACLGTFRPPADPRDRFAAADAGVVIGDALALALAAFAYDGALRRSLGRLKYAGTRRLAEPLARAALPAIDRLLAITGRPATLVPVPASPERRRERGYNQAELIAAVLARERGLPAAELLVRSRETTKQHRLDRSSRLRNLRGAFAPAPAPVGRATASVAVILVDDILTTSATLEACASVLRQAGVGRVYGLAVAREV